MQSYSLFVLAAVCIAAGCDRPKQSPQDVRQFAARALQGTLAYPQSNIVNVAAGTDAAQVDLSSPAPLDRIAQWYREALPLNGWELKNEGKTPDGTVSIYAEKQGRPLWLTLRPNAGGAGTTYTLIGAVIDSTSTPQTPPAPKP